MNGDRYELAEAGVITLSGLDADNEQVTITAKNDRAAVDAGLEKGFGISKLKVGMTKADDAAEWTFSLESDSLRISAIKCPASSSSEPEDDNPDAGLLEKLYLLDQVVAVTKQLFGQP